MSRVRREKNCLNCGGVVDEIYCPHCGQKNAETHVNAFHAVVEFIGDYFHADGKFLKSIVPLLFRPGLMTNEYNSGRREKFIHPFRLYIFVSIVYFGIAYFTETARDRGNEAVTISDPRIRIGDSGISIFRTDSMPEQDDSTLNIINERIARLPSTIEAYRDSIKALPEKNRPDFSDDIINRVAIKYNKAGDAGSLVSASADRFRETLPKLLFFLLPLAALLLKLFYIRRKRFYIEHLVHTLHLHSFIFLMLTFYTLISLFADSGLIIAVAVLCMIVYFFVSMKRVYRQSRMKTFVKGTLFSITYLFFLATIFTAGFLYIFIYD